MRVIVSLVVLSLSISSLSWAVSPSVEKIPGWDKYAADYCFERISDTVGGLWLAHSNRMAMGRPFWLDYPVPDDEELTGDLPYRFDASFPAGSGKDYLYAAGLWVGGIKGTDTLVSHAFDYVAPIPELNPLPCPDGEFQTLSDWADAEHIAVAYDTIIFGDTLYRCQVGDCDDWHPLGIKVTSHSYTWESPPYDRTIIVDYTIQNIDSLPLEEGWVGIYSDCDIGTIPRAFADDASAFMDGAFDSLGNWIDLDVGYSYDLDGDPGSFSFAPYSILGAFGVQVLGMSVPDYRVNFNWWALNDLPEYDWGPRQQDFIIRDLGGSYAAPYGDSNKYFVMSYREIDYPQVEAGIPHPGWVNPDYRGVAAGHGLDTRFLISAGPFNLDPQEEVTFSVAYIAGNHVITNAYIGMWFDPEDPLSVSDYYEVQNLQELQASALAAKAVHDSGYSLPPPGPPSLLRLVEFDDDYVSLIWSRKTGIDVAGYDVLQSQNGGPWDTAAIGTVEDTSAVIANLDPLSSYRFAVVSFDSAGSAGKKTPIISIIPGLPHAPATLTGNTLRLYPQLAWPPSIDPDVSHYRIYRTEQGSGDTVAIAEAEDTVYVDRTIIPAHAYYYFVTAVTTSELESAPSLSIRLLPMAKNSGILVLNHNSGAVSSNLLYENAFLDSLITRALDGLTYNYRLVNDQNPLTLDELANYSLVIVSAENRSGSLTDDLVSLLPLYMASGGKVVLMLRFIGINQNPTSAAHMLRFEPTSFISQYLMIDSSYIGPLTVLPGYYIAGDLTGADSQVENLPSVTWDSARINEFGYNVSDGIPYTGYFWPHSPAEVIYRYRSANPDSTTHGQVSGIRYLGDDYSMYVLNYPLSLMEIDSAAAVLRSAVVDLDEDFICGDVNEDGRCNIGDVVSFIQFLYGGAEVPGVYLAGDVDCNGSPDLGDVLMLVNYLFRSGLSPECCR